MSVMFSDDALQCYNLGLRVNREWAKCYCFSQGESIGLDTFRQSQSWADDCRSTNMSILPDFYLRRSGTMIS
jgi:hypothetical protein